MKKSILLYILGAILLLLIAIPGYSQPIPPDPTAPLDGGGFILLLLGLGFAVRKYFRRSK